jgi:hypothetical protein
LGFLLQSFAPLAQPYTVSGAYTLLSLELTPEVSTQPSSVAGTEAPRQSQAEKREDQNENPRLQGFAPHESPPLIRKLFRLPNST